MKLKEEMGKVIEILDKKAKVQLEYTEVCKSCPGSSMCRALGQGRMVMEAENPIGAEVGQKVIVSHYCEDELKASLILYGIPLVCFLGGCFLGNWLNLLGEKNLSTFLGGLFCMMLSFLGIKVFSTRYETRGHKPVITRAL